MSKHTVTCTRMEDMNTKKNVKIHRKSSTSLFNSKKCARQVTISLYSYFLFGRLWSAFPDSIRIKKKVSTLNVPFSSPVLSHSCMQRFSLTKFPRMEKFMLARKFSLRSLVPLFGGEWMQKISFVDKEKRKYFFMETFFVFVSGASRGRKSLNKFFVCPISDIWRVYNIRLMHSFFWLFGRKKNIYLNDVVLSCFCLLWVWML